MIKRNMNILLLIAFAISILLGFDAFAYGSKYLSRFLTRLPVVKARLEQGHNKTPPPSQGVLKRRRSRKDR